MCRRRREIECRVTPAEIPVFLGLDIGTQSLEAALFDNRFTIAGQGAEPLTYAFAPGGKAEQDPGDWLAALRPAIAKALTMADCPAEAVRGIGAGGHLTGSRKMDHALASTTLLYDIEAGAYDPELCAAFGVGEDSLPETAGMEEPAGTLNRLGAELTGLPQGIPVAVGTGDDFSNAIGVGLLQPGTLLCQIGTAEVVGALSREPVVDRRALVETHRFLGGKYFVENPGGLCGGALEWAVRLLNLDNVQTLTELAAIAPSGSDGVFFLPALTGSMAPDWITDMRACFSGLSAAHGARHLARAIVEGTAFAMHDVQIRLTELGLELERIVLAGGGAASPLWAQIRADVSGLPVDVSATKDASSIGAAALGAVACRAFDDFSGISPFLGYETRRFEPDAKNAPTNIAACQAYLPLFSALRPQHRGDLEDK